MKAIDLLREVEERSRALAAGELSPERAHAEARFFLVRVKTMAVMLEHAKRTGRLRDGSKELPSFDVVDG